MTYNTGFAKFLFFGKCFKRTTTEYFLKFIFLFESTILPVNNGKNFILMAASPGHAVADRLG